MTRLWNQMFVEHPRSVHESYLGHLVQALGFSFLMLIGGIACFIHAFFPGLFTRSGSQIIHHLFDRMVQNRDRTLLPDVAEVSFNDADVTKLS